MLGGSAAVPFLLDVEAHVSINLVAEQLVAGFPGRELKQPCETRFISMYGVYFFLLGLAQSVNH